MKATAQQSGYVTADQGPFRCGGCLHFNQGACELVEGIIDENACCNLYAKGVGSQAPAGPTVVGKLKQIRGTNGGS